MDVGEVRTEPKFIPDEGSTREVVKTFQALSGLIIEAPDEALSAFSHSTPEDIIRADEQLSPDTQTVAARTIRVLAKIFKRTYDFEVSFDQETNKALSNIRTSGPEQGSRVRRIGGYARRRALWQAQINDKAANKAA